MTDRELMQQALEALNSYPARHLTQFIVKTRNALRERLSESVAQPVAWMVWDDNNVPSLTFTKPADKYVFDALYISPQPASKPWVGLTDDDVWNSDELMKLNAVMMLPMDYFMRVVRAIEAKLKEKNA